MATISIKIPQLGEGLQEARIVSFLKQPGEQVSRDEPIYQMETDKAVLDVESPYAGVITSWLADVDAVLPIGADVALMQIEGEAPVEATTPEPPKKESETAPAAPSIRNAQIPPRTRAYAKEKGITEDRLGMIPMAGSKMMPTDVDAFLRQGESKGYDEKPVTGKQRILISRLQRGHHLVVHGGMTVVANWDPIAEVRAKQKATGSSFQPSTFTMFAYAVARAVRKHPLFRSQLIGESVIRTHDRLSLGIAVALPGDDLVIAVIKDADQLEWVEFASVARERIELARKGVDQADDTVTLSLTNLQSFGIRDGSPVVVPPAMGTLFLGEPHFGLSEIAGIPQFQTQVNLSLAFDHRLSNGAGAAQFLSEVKRNVENIGGLL
jgi:pyruvate dehydrogenase E2 component (dihydrolipoamide acetyltransferase)